MLERPPRVCELVAGNVPAAIQDINLAPGGLSCLWIPRKSAFNRSVPMSNSTSPQVKFVHEWFQVLQTRDLDRVANFLHKDYRNTLYPRSLGTPEQTKEEWLEHAAERYKLWTSWEVSCIGCHQAPLCRG